MISTDQTIIISKLKTRYFRCKTKARFPYKNWYIGNRRQLTDPKTKISVEHHLKQTIESDSVLQWDNHRQVSSKQCTFLCIQYHVDDPNYEN